MIVEMQYNPNSLEARDVIAEFAASSSMFGPSSNLKNYVDFIINEPISVLDTRSPSPSTSTSSASASASTFNPPANIFLNERPLHHSLQYGLSQNFSVGVEQDEILKQNEQFACLGGGAAAAPPLILDNVMNLSALGVPCHGDFEILGGLNPLMYSSPNQDQILNAGGVASNLGFLKQLHFPQMLDVAQHPNTNAVVPLQLPCHEAPIDQHCVYNEVCKAAEMIEGGNLSNAQGILARLNHIVAPVGEPFLRSAFYVKEALESALSKVATALLHRIPSSDEDAMFKIRAYNVYSQVSPMMHFMNFTANQLVLEAVGDCERIHIVDFDVGYGAHWSSFLQEVKGRVKSVKITAFASPSTHHSLEINLIHENLTQFATGLGIDFELEVVNIDCFDPNCSSASSMRSSESEAIVVNFPIWSLASCPSALLSYLRLMKRLSPRIIVSMSRGCERNDLPFPLHVLHTLQYYEALLNSIDAANVTCDVSNSIVRFLFQPRIESTLLGRLLSPNTMPSWRKLFASMGYLPVSIGNFAETQAQCLLKRMHVQGFRVKRQEEASLVLCWDHCEIVSVSAWKC